MDILRIVQLHLLRATHIALQGDTTLPLSQPHPARQPACQGCQCLLQVSRQGFQLACASYYKLCCKEPECTLAIGERGLGSWQS